MSIYEVQIMSGGRWMSNNVLDDIDSAYEYAERIERMRRPDQLRIRQFDAIRPGFTRERTVYEGGRKVERDRTAEREREELVAFQQRVADRRGRQNAGRNEGRRKPLFSSNSPIYLTLVSLTIGLTGLSALYLVEKAFS